MGARTVTGGVVVQAPGLSLSHQLPTLVVWLSFGLRGPGAVRRAGEAREGFAKLEAAVPSTLDIPGGASNGGRRSKALAGQDADRVVVGMDPHKRSVTIEVMAGDETILGGGRFATTVEGYRAMRAYVAQWSARVWAIEGCAGIGGHVATRLLGDGEQVVDVPPKLSARARVFTTGQGRKTDAADAHSVALVGTRMSGLRPVIDDSQLAVLRVLVDRRRSLGEDHTRMVSQLHHLLLQLIPGGAKKDLSAAQAKALLASVRPRDTAGKTRRRVAAELIADLERIYQRKKTADKELTALLTQTGTSLLALNGIGPSGAARLLVEVGDITRFPSRAHFASWNGTAPIDASSGDQIRHRLSRAGNRQINRVLHIMATVQLRNHHRPGLLRPPQSRRQDLDGSHASTQTPAVRHRLPHHDQRRYPPCPGRNGRGSEDGPGRTLGGGYELQRGRLEPRHRRFGEVTSRTRHRTAYDPTANCLLNRGVPKSAVASRSEGYQFPPGCHSA
jgi:transposase